MSELKPCPFCGTEAHLFVSMGVYQVGCVNCAASGRNGNKIEAITAWNTRTPLISVRETDEAAADEAAAEVINGS